MDCGKLRHTSQILVGLERIGVVGLDAAFAVAEESEVRDREALIDRMVEVLARDNYLPAKAIDQYRRAVWREYLRRRGEDISGFYSEIDVVVRSTPGTDIDAFVSSLSTAFAKHELEPRVAVESSADLAKSPQLLIDGEVVIEGISDPRRLATAIGRQISDW